MKRSKFSLGFHTSQEVLTHQVARQFHPHENSGHEEAQKHTDKSNKEQKKPIQLGDIWCIGSIQNYES